MKRCTALVSLPGAFLGLTLAAEAAVAGGPVAGVSLDEAKSLVAQIAEVATEFKRNSACTIEVVSPASQLTCHFYMLHAVCPSAKSNPGLSRDLSVNKANGDIEPIDRLGNARVTEPAVVRLQQSILSAHGISEQAAAVARNVSREGCMYK